MKVWAAVFSIAILLVAAASAGQLQIDTAKSEITVRVYKAGVFGALGHDHEIAAPVKSGAVDTSAHTVELRVAAASLKVRDPNASEKERGEIRTTMAGPEVLADAARRLDGELAWLWATGCTARAACSDWRADAAYFTTIFTSLSGTITIFTTCLPARNGWTLSSARAAFSRFSLGAPKGA